MNKKTAYLNYFKFKDNLLNHEIENLIDQFVLNWELKQNQIQDAEEKLFLKYFCLN